MSWRQRCTSAFSGPCSVCSIGLSESSTCKSLPRPTALTPWMPYWPRFPTPRTSWWATISPRTTDIDVEGPHDVEFIGRMLRKGPHAIHYQNAKSKVDLSWHPLIPSSYPVGKPPSDFLRRVPMPIFYQNETHTVAVQSAD